jgi:hypothetical protein
MDVYFCKGHPRRWWSKSEFIVLEGFAAGARANSFACKY